MHKQLRLTQVFIITLMAFSLLWSASLPTAKPEQAGLSSERLQRLTQAMQGYVDQGRAVGLVTLVVRNNHIVYIRPLARSISSAIPPCR